jgi:hypothetical protein
MAMLTKLLTVAWEVRISTGTQQPVGAFAGTVNATWSSPEQHGDRPL